MSRRTVAALVLAGAAAVTAPAVEMVQQEDPPAGECRVELVSPNPEDPCDSSRGWTTKDC